MALLAKAVSPAPMTCVSHSTSRQIAINLVNFVFLQRTGATASPDPYANRVSLSTPEAIARPADQVIQHVQTQELERDRQQQMAQQDQQVIHESQTHSQRMHLG